MKNMKKLFTLIFVMAIINFAIGQQSYFDNSKISKIDLLMSTKNSDKTIGTTDSQEVESFVLSDEFGNPINEFPETVKLYEQKNGPDLLPDITGFVAECYSIPFDQAIISPEGSVTNLGSALLEATDFNLTIGSPYNENLPITIPLESGQTEYFSFPSFSTTETGTLTFTYTANASNDINPDNGTIVKDIEIDSSVLSYNNGDITGAFGIGTPGRVVGNVFYVSTEDELTAVSFYLQSPTIGDEIIASVYEFDDEPGDLIASTLSVIVTDTATEYTAIFPTGVTLPAGNYLIGLVEGEHELGIALTSTPFIANSAWLKASVWLNLGNVGYYHTYLMKGIFDDYIAPDFDIALESLSFPNYTVDDEIYISGVIENKSGEELTSIDIEYTIDGENPLMESFIGLSVQPLETYSFTFTNPTSLTELGAYDIVVTINNANGMGPDTNPENDQLSTIINYMDYAPEKMVVGEEATGTWCGWCVRGIVVMEYMAETYPDNWIGIAVHDYDPMEVTEYKDGIESIISGYPSGLVDRSGVYDPLEFEEGYNERIDDIAPAELMIENQLIIDGILNFDVTATFYAKVANFRLNAVLLEDDVTGTDEGYDQANYYSGGGAGEMGGFENLPNPIPAADMVYMDVSRALLGGWDGVEGSLPDTVYAGETHNYEFSVTLDESWNYSNMRIVGMLINTSSGMIENACVNNDITGFPPINKNNSEFSVYPNPAKDKLNISIKDNSNVYIYNDFGQLIINEENISGAYQVDMSGLQSGTYIIKVISDSQVFARKIFVAR